jgi:pimeloyl-ACP methyl ester carboxylesterase
MPPFPDSQHVLSKRRRSASAGAFLALSLAASPTAVAQIPEAGLLTEARAARLTGLYEFADGARLHVTDLADLLGGRPVLSVTEYATGRLRGLYPQPAGHFTAGPSWFRKEPTAYSIQFEEASGPAVGLTLSEGGATLRARRTTLIEREVTLRSGSLTLAGTLVLPPGRGPHPAVVMVPGSGLLTRKTPRYFGDLIAARGVAVLVTDKRGAGGSGGDSNGLSHAEWAADVHAQLDWLKGQPGIDPARLGLVAGSESGYVAPVVAAARTDIRFLVCRVCPSLPHGVTIVDMESRAMRRRGLSEADVKQAAELLARLIRFAEDRTGYAELFTLAASGEGTKWRAAVPLPAIPPADSGYWNRYRAVLDVDPRDSYRRLRIPVLAILGEVDERVLIDRHLQAYEALRSGGLDLTLWKIEGASHGLLLDEATIPRYPEGFHDRLAGWIVRAAGAR